ncbi:MAG: CAP domain-containing protein, partial [Actinobacteria bacterium]|nr:CAP domain-containing protein [Actinomycetota bacterium]
MDAGHETRSGLIGALFALVLGLAMVLLVASPALADATSDAEACFLSKINAARTATGAQTLQRDASLAGYARIHSQAMADDGSIYHSTTGDLAPYLPSDWVMWGENVGVGGTCAILFDAFMASPLHKENLLNPVFQYAGIGVYIDVDGTLWTTHIFLQRQTATTTTTTTTAPPTTTTTAP